MKLNIIMHNFQGLNDLENIVKELYFSKLLTPKAKKNCEFRAQTER